METPSPDPGLILAGVQSGGGKTAVTCLLLAAWAEAGLPVQPFKVGPDFLDPGYHDRYAGGARSRNLDDWLLGGPEAVRREAAAHGRGRCAVVEGVMGLFDGAEATSDRGSTFELARLLGWPVVLVLPCAKVGRSLAATLRGFVAEAGAGWVRGVILNQVGGGSHADYLREAIAPLGLPVFGALPRCDELAWPERYLGLRSSPEQPGAALPGRAELARLAARFLDLDGLRALAGAAPARAAARLPAPGAAGDRAPSSAPVPVPGRRRRIAVARDEAFHFYYASSLDWLRENGAELVEFSPRRDPALPAGTEGLLLGGGFPELFAEELSANAALRAEVRAALAGGLPCYAECGGLMWLAAELATASGRRWPMVGAVPGRVEMTGRLQHFGYCAAAGHPGFLGETFRGHEFHHSRWVDEPTAANLWRVTRRRLGSSRREGYLDGRLHASYVHLHLPAHPALPRALFSLDSSRP